MYSHGYVVDRMFHKTTQKREEHSRNHSTTIMAFKQRLPVKRTPIPTLTLWTHIRRMTFLSLDFLRCDKFRFAFFALVEVHHVTIKERL
jgi:hypothetical protein